MECEKSSTGICLFSNFLLIQQYYNCNEENHPNHRFSSSDVRILTQLPENALAKFHLVKYHRCLFSCHLIDYVFDQTSRGVNFLQISKAIAQLHVSEYCRLYTVHQGSEAYQNVCRIVCMLFQAQTR